MYKLIFIPLLLSFNAWTYTPDWSSEFVLKEGQNRENIYKLSKAELRDYKKQGLIHALKYPIDISGLYIPYYPIKNVLKEDQRNPFKKILQEVAGNITGLRNIDDMYDWLGLPPFNNNDQVEGIYQIPYPEGVKPDYRMGASIIDTEFGKALTFSCAACHSTQLFGKSIMGLPNKKSRANHFFVVGKKVAGLVHPKLFQAFTKATDEETLMFKRSRDNLKYVGARDPRVLGLDTAAAQVGLSLYNRGKDPYARKEKPVGRRKPHPLKRFVADSKPMPWWNLKYKTKWLSDGSVVSGNPILMNFIWNEIGRGTDLEELQTWFDENEHKVEELTAAVFATHAPKWIDFFPENSININSAKRGEILFNRSCKKCHGTYEKGWSSPFSLFKSKRDQIATTKVIYHKITPVKDVGTDPQRYQAIKFLEKDMNRLKINQMANIKMEAQKGYVPPPLVGIWARYPYFHNNSIPNLCAILTPPEARPIVFYHGPAKNIKTDYDQDCVGYPVGNKMPRSWKKLKNAKFDTRKKGLSNKGHSKFLSKYTWSKQDKSDLIEYLKTL